MSQELTAEQKKDIGFGNLFVSIREEGSISLHTKWFDWKTGRNPKTNSFGLLITPDELAVSADILRLFRMHNCMESNQPMAFRIPKTLEDVRGMFFFYLSSFKPHFDLKRDQQLFILSGGKLADELEEIVNKGNYMTIKEIYL